MASCHVTQAVKRKEKCCTSRLKSALNEAIDKVPFFFFAACLHSSHWKRFPDSPSCAVGANPLPVWPFPRLFRPSRVWWRILHEPVLVSTRRTCLTDNLSCQAANQKKYAAAGEKRWLSVWPLSGIRKKLASRILFYLYASLLLKDLPPWLEKV